MGRDVTVAVAGATGALGKELLAVLDRAPWRPDRVVALASPTTTAPFVDYGGDRVAVDDLRHAVWGEYDAVIFAVPGAVARPLVAPAVADGAVVVDCTGSQFEDLGVPLVTPWINGEAMDAARPREVIAIPTAIATLVGSVTGPLKGLRGVAAGGTSATVLVPASHWGRAGVDELSAQVVALFNSGTPPRKVFDQGLAFDLLPQVGPAAPSGWAAVELRAMTEIARLTGQRVALSVVGTPVFTGISAEITLRLDGPVTAEVVLQRLAGAGLVLPEGARRLPRPRRVDGRGLPQVARVRVSPGEGTLHLWAVMDNLAVTATAAVGVAARLLRDAGKLPPGADAAPDEDEDDED